MSNITTFALAVQGEQMRSAQQLYFQLSAVARKTKTPEAYADSTKQLKVSKQLEQLFDESVREVFKEGEDLPS